MFPLSLTICELGNTFDQKFAWTTGVILGLRGVSVTCGPRGSTQHGSFKKLPKGENQLRNEHLRM